MGTAVRVWEEPVVLPTYPLPPTDPHPLFLDRRVYQGSSGRVYPCRVTDRVSDQPEPRAWRAVHLENEYLYVMVLPEIGGRVHVARDRTNGYDFVYRQSVVKPALVGLLGPWISGGIEFNWPQHHRPTTFLPVEHGIERSPDGSATVWLGEHEPMGRTKGMVGIRLRPRRALLEAEARLYNRTLFVQTFLWWANAGVHAHDDYEAFFPPDVREVADHARRATSRFPIARGFYYGVDYRRGVDLRWWKNIPVPTSYMAIGSRHDFLGGYDHRREAGIVHVADHRTAPGKKLWTWGNAAFGRAWERELTDADGPYVELMAGVFSDNQPDFSWLHPFETRVFTQAWYPIQRIGPADLANVRAAASLRVRGGRARVGVSPTARFDGAGIVLRAGDRVLLERRADLAPGAPFLEEVRLPRGAAFSRLRLEVSDAGGGEILHGDARAAGREEPIEVATEPPAPEEVASGDELDAIGVHLEQYRHATRRPEPYWREALRRDPRDARALDALGRSHLQRGELARAERRFRAAVASQSRRNANPRDGEARYDLGLALRFQMRFDEAYDALAKAAWSGPWQAPASTLLAEIDCRRRRWGAALWNLDRALDASRRHTKALNLKAHVLERLGRGREAEACRREALDLDPLDAWSRAEGVSADAALDVALDLAWAGFFDEALARLAGVTEPTTVHLYAAGWIAEQKGDEAAAAATRAAAAVAPLGPVFPSRLEDARALEAALRRDPADARAHALLGGWLYDRGRHREAIRHWQAAVRFAPGQAGSWRNLGIAFFNVERRPEKARRAFARALAAAPDDARILYEADQLARECATAPSRRLARLERRLDLVGARDDLSVEYAGLLIQVGRAGDALAWLEGRRFHPWEGGEGRALGQYVRARLVVGRAALAGGDGAAAAAHFESALEPPATLGEARHPLANASDVWLALGDACAARGQRAAARRWWARAAAFRGDFQEMSVRTFSEMTRCQALALRRLGRGRAANRLLRSLAAYARRLAREEAPIDYFATSLPDLLLFEGDRRRRQMTVARFLLAQAELELGRRGPALRLLRSVLARDPGHGGAADLLREASRPTRARRTLAARATRRRRR